MSSSTSTDNKTVAVIGAGPGGLVAAQKLLRTNALSVTIFDKQPRVGGLWERNNLINPRMQANFCMFTVAFSDLSWDSVDLGDGKPCPIYPRAWMVEKYLEVYKEKFLGGAEWKLDTNVTMAERVGEKDIGKGQGWMLTSVKTIGGKLEESTSFFDYLLVATGYLSKPRSLSCKITESLGEKPTVPILHSTQYRNIEQLYTSRQPSSSPTKQKVLVVGGSHSGSEISALIAFQASNTRWSPFRASTPPSAVEIVHITSHQMLAVPGFVRNPVFPTCSFQPMEYQLYERSLRGPGPLTHTFGLTNPEESIPTKMMIETQLSGESTNPVNDLPAYVVVSENYTQFVESKVIKPYVGELKCLNAGPNNREVTATVKMSDGDMAFDGITAVINATGFDSCCSINFLSDQVLHELGYEKSNTRLPLVLDASYMAQRSSVPDIAVLGFTGVNWGVMEMQSRAIAAEWSSPQPSASVDGKSSTEVAEHIGILRNAINQGRKSEIPQVLFGDYLGLMEQAARELGVERVDSEFGPGMGMVCPARYMDPCSDKGEAEKQMQKLMAVQMQVQSTGLFLARAVFHGLNGKWSSENGSSIEFHPREPTSGAYEFEYLAVETSTEGGEKRSVYRYDEVNDAISVWSVSRFDNLSAGNLSYNLRFLQAVVSLDPSKCSATVIRSPSAAFEIEPVLAYTFAFNGSLLHSLSIERESKEGDATAVDFRRPSEDVFDVGEARDSGARTRRVMEREHLVQEDLESMKREVGKGLKGNCCSRFDCIP
jgi:hypothetical protein